MKIIFNTTLDTGNYLNYNKKHNQNLFDVKITGPSNLLTLLERETGNAGKYPTTAERQVEYHQILKGFLVQHPDAFFAQSFKNDPMGVSSTLLQIRDQLILSGWNSEAPDISGKINTLRSIEQYEPVSPGQEDRWIRIFNTLKSKISGLQIETIDVLEDVAWMHPFFKDLLNMLSNNGVKINYKTTQKYDAGKTNLDVLKAIVSEKEGKIKLNPEDKSSFQILSFRNEVEAGRFFALQNLNSPDTVIINNDNRVYDNVIAGYGRPAPGSKATKVHSGIIQLFKLAASLFLEPFNINHYLAYLQCPFHPVPHSIRSKVIKHMTGKGGINTTKISEIIESHSFDSKRKKSEAAYFLNPYKSKVNQANRESIVAFYNSLGNWATTMASVKQNDDEKTALQLHHLKNLCQLLVKTIQEDTVETIESEKLQMLVGDLYTPSHTTLRKTEVGSPMVITSPAQLISNPGQTIWLDFYNNDIVPSWYTFLNDAELNILLENNFNIWKPGEQTTGMLQYYLNVIYKTRERLCLVTVEKSGDEPVSDHPLMALLRAKVENLEEFVIRVNLEHTVKIPGWTMPETEVRQKIPLPQKSAEHRIRKGALIPERPVESYSSIERIIQYPFDWLFQYSLDIKPGFATDLPDEETTMGNTAHDVIQILFTDGNNNIKQIQHLLERQYDVFLERGIENRGAILLLEENRFYYHRLKDQLKRSIDILLEMIKENNLEIVGTEIEMKERLPVLQNQEFKGIMDLLLKDESGRPVIIDLKWTRSMNRYTEKLREGKSVQLALYKELAASNAKQTVEKAGYYLLSHNKLLTTNNLTGTHVIPVKPESDDQRIAEKIQSSLAFRRNQLTDGVIEDGEELKPEETAYGREGYAERIKIDIDSNDKIRKNYYSAYQVFKGNYK